MRSPLFLPAFILVALCGTLYGQVNVVTAQYTNYRLNGNPTETVLTATNVNSLGFGKLFTRSLDGYVYAQPLYLSAISINGKTQNVVYVASMHNTLYAFDADDPTAASPLWQVNFGPSVPKPGGYLTPEVGILSTPVIDHATSTIYAVAQTLESGNDVYRLHALDIATGNEKFGGPVVIAGSVSGTGYDSVGGVVTFNAARHLQRPALLEAFGNIYIAFGEANGDPFHGWIMAYGAATLQQTAIFCDTPNGQRGGIWQSGSGLSADGSYVYVTTADGSANPGTGSSFIRLTKALQGVDYFTPASYAFLNFADYDVGITSPLLIPNLDLVVGGSKNGVVYLMNRSNMGHIVAGNTQIVQSFQATPVCTALSWQTCFHIHSMVFWNRTQSPSVLYIWGWNDVLKAYSFQNGTFNTTPVAQNLNGTSNFPGGELVLSSAGEKAGTAVLWATTSNGDALNGTVGGTLHAYDASDVSKELWNSNINPSDKMGNFSKFNTVVVANGKVYVPTFSNQLAVYGLLTH